MNDTLKSYSKTYNEYIKRTINTDISLHYKIFEKYLHKEDKVLDLGCGSGRDVKHFMNTGFNVTAIDGCNEFVSFAKEYTGNDVILMDINNLDFNNYFDGIWSFATLLHFSYHKINNIINNQIYNSLKQNGILYISLKFGKGFKIIDDKWYTFVDVEDIRHFLKIKYNVIEINITNDLLNRSLKWISALAIKK